MRTSHAARRPRQRTRKTGTSDGVFESSGPEVKLRGSARHISERYQALARDALSSGDHVLSENYMQHAEHYLRLLRGGASSRQWRGAEVDVAEHEEEQPSFNKAGGGVRRARSAPPERFSQPNRAPSAAAVDNRERAGRSSSLRSGRVASSAARSGGEEKFRGEARREPSPRYRGGWSGRNGGDQVPMSVLGEPLTNGGGEDARAEGAAPHSAGGYVAPSEENRVSHRGKRAATDPRRGGGENRGYDTPGDDVTASTAAGASGGNGADTPEAVSKYAAAAGNSYLPLGVAEKASSGRRRKETAASAVRSESQGDGSAESTGQVVV